jgi:hypothetical protein
MENPNLSRSNPFESIPIVGKGDLSTQVSFVLMPVSEHIINL